MTKSTFTSSDLPTPGPFSHIAEANGIVFTAGFGPVHPASGETPEGISAQTELTISNLEAALSEVELDLADVIKATVHLADPARDFEGFNDVYSKRFPKPYPVRTTVGSGLIGILVEIDVVALR